MSDSQVLEYVKDGIRQGKEQKQLASELARRGVTKEQATRVKQLYEQQNNVNASNATGTDVNESRLREEMKENTSDMLEDHPSTQDLARGNQVFGRNIFNTRNLTFEPSVNIATPLNYRLGPGDELIIDILASTLDSFKESKGVIFDGFPRTIAQAEALKKMLAERGQEVSVMLDLDVPEEELMTRLIKRGQESGRADDNEETIKKRLVVYHSQTAPLIDWYKNEGKYQHIHGLGTMDAIFADIVAAVEKL